MLAPGVVAGLVPYWLTDWRIGEPLFDGAFSRLIGALSIVAGVPVLVAAFARFVAEGLGTPAPVAPTEHLVIGGLYRYVRNPMYLAVVTVIVGQALVLGQPRLLVYAAIVWTAFVAFVKLYEEPTLQRRYGAEYDAYRRAVRPWWPRLP
jgi:protein-S-isoprenylcysteine O-methyltransferase Ste14